jgi:histidinol-phosphate aminotransferase
MVRGYAGDGVRVTLADPASNDRVLAVLAAFALEDR